MPGSITDSAVGHGQHLLKVCLYPDLMQEISSSTEKGLKMMCVYPYFIQNDVKFESPTQVSDPKDYLVQGPGCDIFEHLQSSEVMKMAAIMNSWSKSPSDALLHLQYVALPSSYRQHSSTHSGLPPWLMNNDLKTSLNIDMCTSHTKLLLEKQMITVIYHLYFG